MKKITGKKLQLGKETLRALQPVDLANVVGGLASWSTTTLSLTIARSVAASCLADCETNGTDCQLKPFPTDK